MFLHTTFINRAKNDFPEPGGPRSMRTILGALILRPGNSIKSVSSVGSGTVIRSFKVGVFRSMASDLENIQKYYPQ